MAGKPIVREAASQPGGTQLNGLDKPLTAEQENYLLQPSITKELAQAVMLSYWCGFPLPATFLLSVLGASKRRVMPLKSRESVHLV